MAFKTTSSVIYQIGLSEQGVYTSEWQMGSSRPLYVGYANSALDRNNDYAFGKQIDLKHFIRK